MKLFRSVFAMLALGLFLAIALVQYGWIGENILRISSDLNVNRISRIETVVKPIQEHPVIGNGIGTFGDVIGMTTRSPATFNVFLTVLFDSGITGLVLFVILLSALAGYLVLLMRRRLTQINDIYLLRAGLYMLLCIMIISQFHPFYMSGYAWLGFALIAATIRIIRDPNRL
jgi:O-antigen ligase